MVRKNKGQTVVEYLLLLAFVALVMIKVVEFIQRAFEKGGPLLKREVIEKNLETGVGFK